MSIVFKAKVQGGALVVDPGIELPEGATVTVYVEDDEPANDESEPITPDEAADLAESVAQADRGEFTTLEELRARLATR